MLYVFMFTVLDDGGDDDDDDDDAGTSLEWLH